MKSAKFISFLVLLCVVVLLFTNNNAAPTHALETTKSSSAMTKDSKKKTAKSSSSLNLDEKNTASSRGATRLSRPKLQEKSDTDPEVLKEKAAQHAAKMKKKRQARIDAYQKQSVTPDFGPEPPNDWRFDVTLDETTRQNFEQREERIREYKEAMKQHRDMLKHEQQPDDKFAHSAGAGEYHEGEAIVADLDPPEEILDLSIKKRLTLNDALQEANLATVFIYSSVDCEHCPQAYADFMRAAHVMAAEEWEMHKKERAFKFFTLDASRWPEEYETIQEKMAPNEPWKLPVAFVTHGYGTPQGEGNHPMLIHPRPVSPDAPTGWVSDFAADVDHAMRRYRASYSMAMFGEESHLMDHLSHTHAAHDGVTIAFMKDGMGLHEVRGDIEKAFSQVRAEEHGHVHFAHFVNATPMILENPSLRETERFPDHTFLKHYNPSNCDVLAFITDEGEDNHDEQHDDADVWVHEFNFTTEYVGETNYYKELLRLRRFVEHMKLLRHHNKGRRFRGLKHAHHALHFHGITPNEHSHRSLSSFADEFCFAEGEKNKKKILTSGSRVNVTLRGHDAESGAVFVEWTQPREIVVGAGRYGKVNGKPNPLHELPPAVRDEIGDGWCIGTEHELYIPASHGFAAEYFEVKVHDPEAIIASASSASTPATRRADVPEIEATPVVEEEVAKSETPTPTKPTTETVDETETSKPKKIVPKNKAQEALLKMQTASQRKTETLLREKRWPEEERQRQRKALRALGRFKTKQELEDALLQDEETWFKREQERELGEAAQRRVDDDRGHAQMLEAASELAFAAEHGADELLGGGEGELGEEVEMPFEEEAEQDGEVKEKKQPNIDNGDAKPGDGLFTTPYHEDDAKRLGITVEELLRRSQEDMPEHARIARERHLKVKRMMAKKREAMKKAQGLRDDDQHTPLHPEAGGIHESLTEQFDERMELRRLERQEDEEKDEYGM